MKHHPVAGHYQKIVYWSDEDGCFVGRCPGLFLGGVHGNDEAKVYADLCATVDEHLAILDRDGVTYPEETAKVYSGTFALRIGPDLHRAIAARAAAAGDSLNRYVERALAATIQPRRRGKHAGAGR
ncbi:MAG: toxin-antitoxin system HicB family antitoxin [Planctomycetes bacterium]|nr:toxin-antitoxin system HicB family antitoxin [Planctomycetota bacterium]